MPPTLPPALVLTLGILVSLAFVILLMLLGLLLSRLKSVSLVETEKMIDDVATHLHVLDERMTHHEVSAGGQPGAGGAIPAPGGPMGAHLSGRGESSRRVDQGAPSGLGRPPLIAIPNLMEPPSGEESASAELARRFGAIWELAESGVSTEAIARVSGYPIGQVELILGLRRQLAASFLSAGSSSARATTEMTELEPSDVAAFERTRSAVLNVLVGIGCGIAVSGLLLRWRDPRAAFRAPDKVRQGLLVALFVLTVMSYVLRRSLSSRDRLRDPGRRSARFFQAHMLSAAIGALAIPLGLAYGWLFQPWLGAVAPFWVAALALGFLALPRRQELEGFEPPLSEPGESGP